MRIRSGRWLRVRVRWWLFLLWLRFDVRGTVTITPRRVFLHLRFPLTADVDQAVQLDLPPIAAVPALRGFGGLVLQVRAIAAEDERSRR